MVKMIRKGSATHTYEVTGNNCATDEELINLCDSGFNFGGKVERHSDGTATVTVYID